MRASTDEWLCELCEEWNTGYSSECWNCASARLYWLPGVCESALGVDEMSNRVRKNVEWSVVRVEELEFYPLLGGAQASFARLYCSDGVSRYGVGAGYLCPDCGDYHVSMAIGPSREWMAGELEELRQAAASIGVRQAVGRAAFASAARGRG